MQKSPGEPNQLLTGRYQKRERRERRFTGEFDNARTI